MKKFIAYKKPGRAFVPVFFFFALFLLSCSGKYNWTAIENLGVKALDLEGEWVCDSMRSAGKYYSGSVFIHTNGSSVYATKHEYSGGDKTCFSGPFSENPFTVKYFVPSPSSGGLEFTYEFECTVGVYSRDSLRLLISDDYSPLFVRKR